MRNKGVAALAVAVAASAAVVPAAANSAAPLPAVSDLYAPGAVRAGSDAEHALVAAFVSAHPEYERLGHEGVLQIAATFKDSLDHYIDGELRAAGVPLDWEPFDDIELALAEEQL